VSDVGAGRLAGKGAIIVGAGQTEGDTIGNGRATALLFARAGASVICVDRDIGRAAQTVELITDEGGAASAFEADITIGDDCDAVVAGASDWHRTIDIVVNNAGIGGFGDGPAHRASDDAVDHILAVNVRGMWRMCKAVLPVMRSSSMARS
jgi:NAD(P)-dependent dehydrogenase (short-subunit alcohol dehydrogenase family)